MYFGYLSIIFTMSTSEKIELNKDRIDLSKIQNNAGSQPAEETQEEVGDIDPSNAEETSQFVSPPDDPIERRKLILTLQNYYSSAIFGKALAKFPQNLESMTIAELENVLKDVKFTVANIGSGSFINGI